MLDWHALEPLSAEALFLMVRTAVRDTRAWVDRNARLSHVGFRSDNRIEWESLLDVMAPHGDVCMTYKDDGRKIPFIKLYAPIKLGDDLLEYIELPSAKPVVTAEPNVVVVYQITGENRPPLIRNGYDVREQEMHARDFIERDKGRHE